MRARLAGAAVADLMAPLRESLAAARERRSVDPGQSLTLAELHTVECRVCAVLVEYLPECGCEPAPVLCAIHYRAHLYSEHGVNDRLKAARASLRERVTARRRVL